MLSHKYFNFPQTASQSFGFQRILFLIQEWIIVKFNTQGETAVTSCDQSVCPWMPFDQVQYQG